MSQLVCEGWWDQRGLGRQPMEQLEIQFGGGSISGAGVDIIGAFTLSGSMDAGNVVMLKRYLGRHSVDYFGVYDGEGTMHGEWNIEGMHGPWVIKIISAQTSAIRIQDIAEIG